MEKQEIIKSVVTDFVYYLDYKRMQNDVFGFMGFIMF